MNINEILKSYKINDEPEEKVVETNNNGRINNYEEEIGADGKVKVKRIYSNEKFSKFEIIEVKYLNSTIKIFSLFQVLSASTESAPLEEVGEPMPQPAKRVSSDDAEFTRRYLLILDIKSAAFFYYKIF